MSSTIKIPMVLVLAFLILSGVHPVHAADDRLWKKLDAEANHLMEEKKFQQAKKKAEESLEVAQNEFGEVNSYVCESLTTLIKIERFSGTALDDPKIQGLIGRLISIQPRVVMATQEIFLMRWKYGEPSKKFPDAKHIIMTFVDFPNHYMELYSPDLGDYLEKLGKDEVKVYFAVSYDPTFNKITGYNEFQIGELKKWQNLYQVYGVTGDKDPSPWDQLVEKFKQAKSGPAIGNATNNAAVPAQPKTGANEHPINAKDHSKPAQ